MLLHNCHCRYDDGQMDMKIRVACKMAYESLRVWRTNRCSNFDASPCPNRAEYALAFYRLHSTHSFH